MHEVSVMQSVLDIALEQAQRQGARQIHRIALRVGPLSGVVTEALEFAFDVVTGGTPAEGACLEVERTAVLCFCPGCDREFQPASLLLECPQCRKNDVQVRQGRELELTYLEVS